MRCENIISSELYSRSIMSLIKNPVLQGSVLGLAVYAALEWKKPSVIYAGNGLPKNKMVSAKTVGLAVAVGWVVFQVVVNGNSLRTGMSGDFNAVVASANPHISGGAGLTGDTFYQ